LGFSGHAAIRRGQNESFISQNSEKAKWACRRSREFTTTAPPARASRWAVSRANPAADSIVGTPPTDFAVHFCEAYAAASLQGGDFTVNGIAADSVTPTGASDATFHYSDELRPIKILRYLPLPRNRLGL